MKYFSRKIGFLCIIGLVVFMPNMTFAQTENTQVLSDDPSNDPACASAFSHIHQQIRTLGECWEDSDCVVVNFGCPWQDSPCHHSIASKNEQDEYAKIVDDITQFNKNCLAKHPQMKKQCQEFGVQQNKVRCVAQKLQCIQGRCMTHVDVILQDIADGPGAESSGSGVSGDVDEGVDDPKGGIKEYLESKGIKRSKKGE